MMKTRGGPPLWLMNSRGGPPFLGCMLMNSRGGLPILRGGPPLETISMDQTVCSAAKPDGFFYGLNSNLDQKFGLPKFGLCRVRPFDPKDRSNRVGLASDRVQIWVQSNIEPNLNLILCPVGSPRPKFRLSWVGLGWVGSGWVGPPGSKFGLSWVRLIGVHSATLL